MQKSQNKAQLQKALSQWENEGGAGANGPKAGSLAHLNNIVELEQSPTHSIFAISLFFIFTFTWSWIFGFFAIFTNTSAPVFSMILSIISGFGPSIAALATVSFFSGRTVLFTWLTNALNWRVSWQWYALAFFMPPLVMLLAQIIHWALGGTIPTSPAVGHVPFAVANFGLVFLIGGPLGEELGWRSYAVPALGSRMGWRTTSLFVGVIWGVWHVPWFFTAGTAQSQMQFAVFMFNIIAGSVLFSWLFLRSKGSIIPALIAHTSLNACAGILSIVPTPETSRPYALVTGILVGIACWVLLRPDAQQSASTLKE
jgi:uncharacterized protein